MRNVLIILLSIFSMMACQQIQIDVDDLRCESLIDPLGIDCLQPRLSWKITSDERNIQQETYHILVASSLEKLNANEGDIWNSGEVDSNNSVLIPYSGNPLKNRTTYFWKVKVTTNRGKTEWSNPATWTMGLVNESEWKAKWTGLDKSFEWDAPIASFSRLSARYFRKEFDTEKEIKQATIYLSGLGLYKLYINGETIGDQELAPTPTDYTKSIKYNTFDVTKQLSEGKNAIGVALGNGRFLSMRPDGYKVAVTKNYGFPKMILQLEVNYTDGSSQTIISDDTWKVTADGPIRANNEFDGEDYDATKEMPGWNQTGFDDSKWLQAELVESPGGKLEAQTNLNIKVMETLKPIDIKKLNDDVYILDMGQNMVGWVRMKVKGNKGDHVKLRFAETTNPDGSVYMANIRHALVTDNYTLKGEGTETYEPSFVYHGFRYVEITGFPGTPTIEDFEGCVLYDEMETTGTFETSNELINQIYKNAYWGIRGNYRGMPTDCPQRDERMGWLGDRAVGSHGESFIFDNNNLYAKWLDDIEDAQTAEGSVPDVVPNYWDFYSDNMTWPAAYLTIANMLYEQYGNKEPIVKHYESMKKWVRYMKSKYMVDNIISKDIYGDWCMPPEKPEMIHSADPARKTDGAILATSFYYRMLSLLERFALIQDKSDEAAEFANEAKEIKAAYNDKFLNKVTAQYGNNTVTANLLSLTYGMVPEGLEEKVFQNIVDKTVNDFDSHVSTGLIGIQQLMRGLSDYGRADLAYKIVTNRDYPSWGYMIENGATTIWELWNGNTADPAMNSHNHVMLLGDLIVWFYEYLAGIQNTVGSNGFEKITMKPYPVDGLNFVKASYNSVRGLIESDWKKENGKFLWNITVPANSTATVYIPATDHKNITESGISAMSAEGVKFLNMEGNYAVFEIGSGKYKFVSN